MTKRIMALILAATVCVGMDGNCEGDTGMSAAPVPLVTCNTNYWNAEARVGCSPPAGYTMEIQNTEAESGFTSIRWERLANRYPGDTSLIAWYSLHSFPDPFPKPIQEEAATTMKAFFSPGDEILLNGPTLVGDQAGWSWVIKSTSTNSISGNQSFHFVVYAGLKHGDQYSELLGFKSGASEMLAYIPLLDTALTLCGE